MVRAPSRQVKEPHDRRLRYAARVSATTSPLPAPGLLRAHATLLVLTLINLLNYLDRYVISGMLPLVQQEFGRSDAQMGVLSSSFLVVYALASPVTGVLGDRLQRKWFVAGGVLLWSAATVWSGMARSFEELLFARALIGVGEAGYAAVAPGMIADVYDVRRRGRMLSYFYAALPVGSALGFTLGGAVGQHYGWRSAFLVAGVPGVALALLAMLLREPARGGAGEAHLAVGRVAIGTIVRTLARTRSFVVNTAGYTAATFAMGGLAAWWPTFLYRERGVPLDCAGFLFGAVLVVAGFLGTLAGGLLGDRIHAKNRGGYFLAAGWGLLLATPAGAVAVLGASPAIYWPATFLALFFLFFNTGPLNAAIVNVVPPDMRASAIAVNVLVIHMLGDALSPWLIGKVSDASSLGMGVLLDCVAIAVAGAILFAGAGVLRATWTRSRRAARRSIAEEVFAWTSSFSTATAASFPPGCSRSGPRCAKRICPFASRPSTSRRASTGKANSPRTFSPARSPRCGTETSGSASRSPSSNTSRTRFPRASACYPKAPAIARSTARCCRSCAPISRSSAAACRSRVWYRAGAAPE